MQCGQHKNKTGTAKLSQCKYAVMVSHVGTLCVVLCCKHGCQHTDPKVEYRRGMRIDRSVQRMFIIIVPFMCGLNPYPANVENMVS